MKKLCVTCAGLGWNVLEREKVFSVAGLRFEPRQAVFPSVTCVAQATLRTGLAPSEHGMVSNGRWFDLLQKPMFWEQSARLVRGERVWAARRAAGAKVGMFFFQQSLGEEVDAVVSPAPVHKHGGGMIMGCYCSPNGAEEELTRRCGSFPLWRYWGPLASAKVGHRCIDWFEAMLDVCDVDEAYLYLPTLDYAAQRSGPGSPQDRAAFAELVRQLERLAGICSKRGAAMEVRGDYAIVPVGSAPSMPNVALRKAGLFNVRNLRGMAYPDFYSSKAFAMCDHEFCVVYGPEREKACDILCADGAFERAQDQCALPQGGTILLAPEGSWCDYKWWTCRREAPDYASHVDIHNKPGFDPSELFFFGRGTVKGTHGRARDVAASV